LRRSPAAAAHPSSPSFRHRYGVDSNLVKEYFPLTVVVEETMAIYQDLLGLTFEEVEKGTFDSWHEDVRLFVVRDARTEDLIGYVRRYYYYHYHYHSHYHYHYHY